MTDLEAALKAARTEALCASHDVALKYGRPDVGRLKDEIADLILSQRQEAKIEALRWANELVEAYCGDGGGGLVVITKEIARLEKEIINGTT